MVENEKAVFDPIIVHILENREKNQANIAINYFLNFHSNLINEQLKAKINLAHSYFLANNLMKAQSIFEALSKNSNL